MNPRVLALSLVSALAVGAAGGAGVSALAGEDAAPVAAAPPPELPTGAIRLELDDNGRSPCSGSVFVRHPDHSTSVLHVDVDCVALRPYGEATRVAINRLADGTCAGSAASPVAGSVEAVVDCAVIDAALTFAQVRTATSWPDGAPMPARARADLNHKRHEDGFAQRGAGP